MTLLQEILEVWTDPETHWMTKVLMGVGFTALAGFGGFALMGLVVALL